MQGTHKEKKSVHVLIISVHEWKPIITSQKKSDLTLSEN